MKQKKMKVQYKSRMTFRGYSGTPMIQMAGNWLESLGFSIGDTIMLEYDNTGIRIRPMTEAEKEESAREKLERSILKMQAEASSLQKQVEKGKLSMAAKTVISFGEMMS